MLQSAVGKWDRQRIIWALIHITDVYHGIAVRSSNFVVEILVFYEATSHYKLCMRVLVSILP